MSARAFAWLRQRVVLNSIWPCLSYENDSKVVLGLTFVLRCHPSFVKCTYRASRQCYPSTASYKKSSFAPWVDGFDTPNITNLSWHSV